MNVPKQIDQTPIAQKTITVQLLFASEKDWSADQTQLCWLKHAYAFQFTFHFVYLPRHFRRSARNWKRSAAMWGAPFDTFITNRFQMSSTNNSIAIMIKLNKRWAQSTVSRMLLEMNCGGMKAAKKLLVKWPNVKFNFGKNFDCQNDRLRQWLTLHCFLTNDQINARSFVW